MPQATESKLPSAQIQRRERLQAQMATEQVEQVENGENPAPNAEVPEKVPFKPEPTIDTRPTVEGPRIEVEELTRLREETERANKRASLLELELQEARSAPSQPLTTPPTGSKAGDEAPGPAAPADRVVSLDVGDTQLNEDEQRNYDEAEPVIVKLARREVASLLNPLLARIEARFATLETGVNRATDTAVHSAETNFIDRVKSNVANFATATSHPKWGEFLTSEIPLAGIKFKDALATAHGARNLAKIQELFKVFEEKYQKKPDASGFDAIDTSQGGDRPSSPASPSKIPFSARKQASEDFMKGRITKEQLDEISNKYKKAEKSGNIDYDK